MLMYCKNHLIIWSEIKCESMGRSREVDTKEDCEIGIGITGLLSELTSTAINQQHPRGAATERSMTIQQGAWGRC